jgi:hypothetical protein
MRSASKKADLRLDPLGLAAVVRQLGVDNNRRRRQGSCCFGADRWQAEQQPMAPDEDAEDDETPEAGGEDEPRPA